MENKSSRPGVVAQVWRLEIAPKRPEPDTIPYRPYPYLFISLPRASCRTVMQHSFPRPSTSHSSGASDEPMNLHGLRLNFTLSRQVFFCANESSSSDDPPLSHLSCHNCNPHSRTLLHVFLLSPPPYCDRLHKWNTFSTLSESALGSYLPLRQPLRLTCDNHYTAWSPNWVKMSAV